MNVAILQLLYFYYRAQHPEIQTTAVLPAAIACHESGNFSAGVYMTKNNCFGMKTPNKRETTCTNKGQGGFADFDSISDSVEDFLLWQVEFGLTDDGKLDRFLKEGRYCPDKGYYEAINRMIVKLQADNSYLDYTTVKCLALGGVGLLSAGAVVAYNNFKK